MISAINSILEPELLVNAANNIDAANNMTKGRTDVEVFGIDNHLNIYKANTKNAVDVDKLSQLIISILARIKQAKMACIVFAKNAEIKRNGEMT